MHKKRQHKTFHFLLPAIFLGVFNYFLYDLTGRSPLAALLAPCNESVWEHLKPIFFPVLFSSCAEYCVQRPKKASFFLSRLAGAGAGMCADALLSCAYLRISGRRLWALDLPILILCIFFSFHASSFFLRRLRRRGPSDPMAVFFAWFLAVLLFFILTGFPPELILFLPPQP